jgi:hypothetical protein
MLANKNDEVSPNKSHRKKAQYSKEYNRIILLRCKYHHDVILEHSTKLVKPMYKQLGFNNSSFQTILVSNNQTTVNKRWTIYKMYLKRETISIDMKESTQHQKFKE